MTDTDDSETSGPGDAPSESGGPGGAPKNPQLSDLELPDLRLFAWEVSRRWKDRFWVVGLALLVFIPLLGSFGLWDPWETHYGEVARQITERNDWISPWWGSHWEDGQGQQEGGYFFSKPILLMWMMAAGLEVLTWVMQTFGPENVDIFAYSEWAIRFGVTVIAAVGLGFVYSFGASVFRRRTGFLMAGVLGTSPFWYFLSRQAQTDMPLVGLMTIGLCLFMMAEFGEDRHRPPDLLSYGVTYGFLTALTVPQIQLLLVGLSRWRGGANPFMRTISQPAPLGVAVGAVPLLIGVGLLGSGLWIGRDGSDASARTRRRLAVGALAAVWVPSAVTLIGALVASGAPLKALNGWFVWGPTQASLYATCLGGSLYLGLARPMRQRRNLYLIGFYTFVALATLGKGLLGFLLPGAVLFIYILSTREWARLRDVELPAGTLAFVAVGVPWFAAMLVRHPHGFWQRFFIHDHFKRLAAGVHQIDTGSFEHFIRWLGYGLFPWSALIPAALGQFLSGRRLELDSDRARATLLLLIWALVAFTLFTLSSTKFHHYIFPAVPPLAMIVALAIDDALDREIPEPWPLYLAALPIFGLLAWDLIGDPQLLKNLFTYKYERKWDAETWNSGFRFWMTVVAIPAALGFVWMLVRNRIVRRAGLALVGATAAGMMAFGLYHYMPTISSTWSQRGVWEAYYDHCTRVEGPPSAEPMKRFCKEEAIAYKLNWRGETYYTQNQVIPIRDDKDWDHFIKEQGDEAFYGIMQRGRYHGGFKRSLPPRFEGKSCILYRENIKFVLVKVPCSEADRQRAEAISDD